MNLPAAGVCTARTYVMGYWPVPENTKRSLEHYFNTTVGTLQMISNRNLYFLSDDDHVINTIIFLSEKCNVRVHVKKMTISDMEKSSKIETLLIRTNNFGAELRHPPTDFKLEKGLVHYWRDLRRSGEKSFRKVFCVWHSKIDLLYQASIEDRFSTREFCWIDASISRFNKQRVGWDFTSLPQVQSNKIYHYPNIMPKNGKQLRINASHLLGDKVAVANLKAAYDAMFEVCLAENYPNDEETVLDSIITSQPALFQNISALYNQTPDVC